METLEAVDDYDSCRSSVISDLEELEANLYSYVHHERNSCLDEYSTIYNVSSLEGVCQQNEILVEDENVSQNSSSFAGGCGKSLGAEENCSKSSDVNLHGELIDSRCSVTRNESDSSCCVHSSGNVVPVQLSPKKAKSTSGICLEQSGNSSPSVLEVSSSDELDPAERNLSKYKIPAASTPVKECVVIDDSDEDVQIEFERFKTKSKKKNKRKKSEIKEDIRLNTRSSSELVCLDVDEEFTFSEKENIDSLLFGHGNENSDEEGPLCKSWTPQMAQFYDEPWGGECINLSELQRTMSDDGWKVDVSDEFSSLTSKFQNRRYFGVKSKAWCTKCNQKGHYRNECTEKTSPPRCRRCGSSRHQEYSCNQKICLTCGRVRSALVAACQQCRQCSWKKCYICQQPGHPPGCCPDLWRRFHATIAPGEIVEPQNVSYKDPKNTYCCNCASRGHHVFQCKKNKFSDYTPMNPKVTSYVDPETLLKFQNTCSRTATNWENVGAMAPEYQSEDRESYRNINRGIKRQKMSGNQQKSKHRKLNENTGSKPESVAKKNSKKQKSEKSKEMKKSVSLKVKKGVMPEKRSQKQGKSIKTVDIVKLQNSNSKSENTEHKDTLAGKGRPIKTGINKKEDPGPEPETGFVERIIVLSPGHLKRIESEEGKEILKYVTDQFKGVTARVASYPSGVLRLQGTGNNIERIKVKLFDVLNNKCGLDNLKKSLNSTGNGRKPNKRKNAAVVRSKAVKKKFPNGSNQSNQLDMRHDDLATTNPADLRMKISNTSCKIKKKNNAVNRLKGTLKNGKGNKSNHQGKQCYWATGLCNGINQICDPPINHLTDNRHLSSSEMRKSYKYKEEGSEILQNKCQVSKDVTHTGTARPQFNHSKVQLGSNGKQCTKRNKRNGEMTEEKLRVIKSGDRKNGIQPVSNRTIKRQRKMGNWLDMVGLITVEVGHERKVSISDNSKYDHSRNSKKERCSQNSSNTQQSPVQNSSNIKFSTKVS